MERSIFPFHILCFHGFIDTLCTYGRLRNKRGSGGRVKLNKLFCSDTSKEIRSLTQIFKEGRWVTIVCCTTLHLKPMTLCNTSQVFSSFKCVMQNKIIRNLYFPETRPESIKHFWDVVEREILSMKKWGKCAGIAWCHRVNMDPNLNGMFPASCGIRAMNNVLRANGIPT